MLVFFRHSKTQWNVEKRLQGKEGNSPLLPLDDFFISNIQKNFYNIKFDEILISPAKRTIDFSDILALECKLKKIIDDINEISFGDFSGKKISEIDNKLWQQRELNKWLFKPPKGESYLDLYNRLDNISNYLKQNVSKNIAIIGHETCNKVLIGKLLNYEPEKILKLKQPNSCVYKIENNELYIRDFNGEFLWEKL